MTDKHRREDTNHQSDRGDAQSGIRDSATRAYESTVEKASHTFESSRDLAADAARRTAAGIDSNPLGVVVGGLALGLVAGALLPRSARERELLAPVGAKLGERARTAFAAAQDAGKAELDNLGISRDAAKDQVRTLFDGVLKAATAAGQAAAKSTSAGNTADA
jgi:ElaB/YqjD/DUF883 family membrane-anchored ribosome-binding protein